MSHHKQLVQKPTAITSIPARPFMDSTGQYEFRAYLGGLPPDSLGQQIVNTTLAQINAKQADLSNSQLYEELHASLCGSEPLEQEEMLLFMSLCVNAIEELIQTVAEGVIQERKLYSPGGEPKTQLGYVGPTYSPEFQTGLLLATDFSDEALHRIAKLKFVSSDSPRSALVYQLTEYLGCNDDECAVLLDESSDRIRDRRLSARLEIVSPELRPDADM